MVYMPLFGPLLHRGPFSLPIHFMPIYGRKMYGQLKRPPMEEWSKQRHVDHVALIYFQKMSQVLTPHTSKLPKKVLKNTKNMTPNSCSVRPEKFHPYAQGLQGRQYSQKMTQCRNAKTACNILRLLSIFTENNQAPKCSDWRCATS